MGAAGAAAQAGARAVQLARRDEARRARAAVVRTVRGLEDDLAGAAGALAGVSTSCLLVALMVLAGLI